MSVIQVASTNIPCVSGLKHQFLEVPISEKEEAQFKLVSTLVHSQPIGINAGCHHIEFWHTPCMNGCGAFDVVSFTCFDGMK